MPRRQPGNPHPCPCGSGLFLEDCCLRFMQGQPAPTAEALMRSRYTAYVLGNQQYLLETWHTDTRPTELDLSHPPVKWLELRVLGTKDGGTGDTTGEVEFIARCRINGKADKLHEVSRFVRQSGKWVYLDATTGIL